MNDCWLRIDGDSLPIRVAWVHLQQVAADSSVADYTLGVGTSSLAAVFGPSQGQGSRQQLLGHIKLMIDDVGTFFVEGCFDKAAALEGQVGKDLKWVIATVDHVAETPAGLELRGKAVPFAPTA